MQQIVVLSMLTAADGLACADGFVTAAFEGLRMSIRDQPRCRGAILGQSVEDLAGCILISGMSSNLAISTCSNVPTSMGHWGRSGKL